MARAQCPRFSCISRFAKGAKATTTTNGSAGGNVQIKRKITLMNGIALIVGSIIGSGIFVSPKGVFEYSGSVGVALIIWLLSGIFSTIGAYCFIELGTSIKRSGGDYAYILEAFGPLPAFLRLWIAVIITQPTTLAIVALTFAQYTIKPLFPDCDPPDDTVLRLLAALCLTALTYVNCVSVRWAMRIQDVFTWAKLFALLFIIVAGFIQIARGQTQNFENSFQGEFDMESISLSFYAGLFAYGGWNALNFVTGEMIEPDKNLPRAVWIAMPLVTLVYVLANVAYFAVVPSSDLLESPAVAVTFAYQLFPIIAWAMPVFVALSTFGGVNGILFTSGRMFYIAAQEGHLPVVLSMIHVKRCTPTPALIFTCGLSLVMLCTSNIFTLINYFSFTLWLSVAACILGLFYLRWKMPNLDRPVKVNLIFPAFFLCCCSFLLILPALAKPKETGIGALITLAGIPVYYLIQWKSKPKVVINMHNYITIKLQQIFEIVQQDESEESLLAKEKS
uniref:Amino acid permease/ SLC12A domain-containing protein n=1 Tax=Strigamia maritima TaxID=126957 RepID=T1J266_STRMM